MQMPIHFLEKLSLNLKLFFFPFTRQSQENWNRRELLNKTIQIYYLHRIETFTQ